MPNFIRRICPRIIVCLVGIVVPGRCSAQAPPLWGQLSPGPHGVGFMTLWQFDYSRAYSMTFADKTVYASGKAPRPILINMWYPARKLAQVKAMPHRDYLNIASSDPRLTKFAAMLADYNRGVIAKELLGKAPKELNERERALLDQFLDTPTACIRNAASAVGHFPLLIYHAGYGSSIEDNSVLCEFLASHGYVVLGSAYQDASGKSFNVDGKEGSCRDFEFLIAYSRQLTNVDWNHIGIVGHSGGAHAALIFRSQQNSVVDAVVSLDTTQDYFSVADSRWNHMTVPVTAKRHNLTGPILLAANTHAFFQLADSLQSAPRYYFTINDLSHNDFISQGVIHNTLVQQLHAGIKAANSGDAEATGAARVKAVRTGYEALCVFVLRFLDAQLKRDAASNEFLAKQYRDTKVGGAMPHVEFAPVGESAARLYEETASEPPTPRQLHRYLQEHGGQKTIAVLNRFRKEEPEHPIYKPIFGFALVFELLDQGKTKDATALRDYFRQGQDGVDIAKMLYDFGNHYKQVSGTDFAASCFRKVLQLQPDDARAANALKELAEPAQKP